VSGRAHARRAVARALESDATDAMSFAWTAPARRLESRLNVMIHEAARASTLEERSALYEEAHRVERVLDARPLLHDDWVALRAWKAQRLRLLLSHKLLAEPVGPKPEGRLVAPGPAIAPDMRASSTRAVSTS